jgi:hypothetical protein
MNAKEALKVLVGSIAVYGAMVACSSASNPGQPVAAAMADINAGGSRLKANYYEGSDGSQQFLSTFHDAQRGEDCAFATASDGTIRCLPVTNAPPGASPPVYSVYYGDAACTMPIVAVSTCTGNTTPKYVSVGGFPGGAKGSAVYKVGATASIGAAYQLTYGGPLPGLSPNACNGFAAFMPTCTPVPSMDVDAGTGNDAGASAPPAFPPPQAATWSNIESSSTIYTLVEVPPSDFVQATTKTTM